MPAASGASGPIMVKATFSFPAKVDQVGMRRQRQVLQLGFGRGACIAGGDEDSGDFGRLCQFPGQCVFTAAAADNEQFHGDSLN